jgi:hypothetical protein
VRRLFDSSSCTPLGFGQVVLHLGALWALAFAAPLLDLLGTSPEFFVARGNTASDIVVFALVYVLAPPLAAALIVWAVGRIRPVVGWCLHLVLLAVLVAGLVLPPLGDALSGSSLSVAGALVLGAGAALLYASREFVRTFLTVLSLAPVFFLVMFLFFSPVSDLVMPGDASSSASGPSKSSTPIVHIVLDELPLTTIVGAGGTIDAEKFPNLARFAEHATWYRNATTVAALTLEAVPAQLTGNRPENGRLPTAGQNPHNLFTLFSRSHELSVVEPLTDICPRDLCAETRPAAPARLRSLASDLSIVAEHLLLPDDLRLRLPPVDQGWEGFNSVGGPTATPDSATSSRPGFQKTLLQKLEVHDARVDFRRLNAALDKPRRRPPLIFMHSTLPHTAWRYLPDGRSYVNHRDSVPGTTDGFWTGTQWLADQSFQRHVLQSEYTDTLVGGLLDKLRDAGLFDKAVIVITADHGSNFRSGYFRRKLDKRNMSDLAPVPFFVKLPGQRAGKVDDRAVRTVDVLPTIAKATGTRLPWKVEGMPADEREVDFDAPIDMTHAEDPAVTLPLREVLAGVRRREAYEERILGDDVYAVGSRPDLLGRPVGPQTPVGDGPRVTIDAPEDYDDVRSDEPLPVFVTGAATGLPRDALIAVAVNGRVVATGHVYPRRKASGLEYSVLLPPDSLRQGANAIEVLQVLGDDRLRAVGTAGR